MECTIWGNYRRRRGKDEIIDTAKDHKEAEYLVNEYKMAYGPDWVIWYDEPHTIPQQENRDEALPKNPNTL